MRESFTKGNTNCFWLLNHKLLFKYQPINMESKFPILIVLIFLLNEGFSKYIGPHYYEGRVGKCSKCSPGWGVVEKCSKYNDTVCEKCEYGKSFSTHYSTKSPCISCSRCGIGLYEAHRCSRTKDTICDECISIIGQKNFIRKNDFNKKCSFLNMKKHHAAMHPIL